MEARRQHLHESLSVDVRWLGLGTVGLALSGVIVSVAVAKGLGTADFARWSVLIATGALVYGLIDVRFWETLARATNEEPQRIRGLVWASYRVDIAVGVASLVTMVAMAGPLARIVPSLSGPSLLPALAALGLRQIAVSADDTLSMALRQLNATRMIATGSLARGVLRAIGTVVVINLGYDLVAVLLVDAAAAYVKHAVLVRGVLVALAGYPSGAYPWRRLLLANWRLLASTYVVASYALLGDKMGDIVLGIIDSLEGVAQYRATLFLIMPVVMAQGIMHQAVYPRVVSGSLGPAWVKGRSQKMLLSGLGVVVTATIVCPTLLRRLYDVPSPPRAVIAFIVLAEAICICLVWTHPVAIAQGRFGVPVLGLALGAFTYAGVALLIIPPLGASGALIALSLSKLAPYAAYWRTVGAWWKKDAVPCAS